MPKIKFDFDWGITSKVRDIVDTLDMDHIKKDRLICMRSVGSQARGTIARCYSMSRIWQKALGIKAHYIIEVISKEYDKLNEVEKEKTLIHELLHIPYSFGGGFKHHSDHVTESRINRMHKDYVNKKRLKD